MSVVAQVGNNFIGTYRPLKLLRQGKACQILEALRDADDQRCVLKVLREEYRQNRDELGLLKHEFTVGRELHHENCIEVYEYDIVRGVPFVALEYFNSLNLKQWIREPGARGDWLPSIIEQAALGILHLHQRGWIHRDLKPDNLLVDDQCQVKLIDFAIAQKLKRGFGRLLNVRGKVAGTRSYMSPEQIRNENLDFRSDVYSFGCVVFELVSGKPPYTGTSADELLQRHLKAPVPSLMAVSESASEALSELVARAMAKRREERPKGMDDFLDAFKKIRLPFGSTRD